MTDDTTGRARRRLPAVVGANGGRALPSGASTTACISAAASAANDDLIAGDLAVQFARDHANGARSDLIGVDLGWHVEQGRHNNRLEGSS